VNPFTLTDEMISDILVAAFEGGINYWAANIGVVGGWPDGAEYASDIPTRGGSLLITLDPELDESTYVLDLARIKRGIRKAAELQGKTPLAFYEDHDATSADLAVQLALFNEVVYG